MTIFEQLLGEMPGNVGGQSSTWQNLFVSLFKGLPGGMNASGVGGLAGLVNRFEAHGMGPIIQSWMHGEHPLPITPTQLQAVLGTEHTQRLAATSGMSCPDMLRILADELPAVVRRFSEAGLASRH